MISGFNFITRRYGIKFGKFENLRKKLDEEAIKKNKIMKIDRNRDKK